MRKWTDEERKKQAERCRQNKPWEKSTGPRTKEGKDRSKMNAYTKGNYTGEYKVIRRALSLHRQFLILSGEYIIADERRRSLMALRERTDTHPHEISGLEDPENRAGTN